MADRTESRISMAAPPAQIMSVIADLEAYPDWNTEVRSVEVLTTHPDGRPAQVRFVIDASPIRDTYVLDYSWQGADRVSWKLAEASVLAAMDGSYDLRAAGPETTEVTYALAVDLRIPVLSLLKRKGERVIIDRALSGLKKRVEGRSP